MTKTKTRKFRTKEEIQSIMDDYATRPDGENLSEFSRRVGVPGGTILHWIKRGKPKNGKRPSVVKSKVAEGYKQPSRQKKEKFAPVAKKTETKKKEKSKSVTRKVHRNTLKRTPKQMAAQRAIPCTTITVGSFEIHLTSTDLIIKRDGERICTVPV